MLVDVDGAPASEIVNWKLILMRCRYSTTFVCYSAGNIRRIRCRYSTNDTKIERIPDNRITVKVVPFHMKRSWLFELWTMKNWMNQKKTKSSGDVSPNPNRVLTSIYSITDTCVFVRSLHLSFHQLLENGRTGYDNTTQFLAPETFFIIGTHRAKYWIQFELLRFSWI